uniref:CUB domain-containing protein n=1 Tax=Stomoxys calcitrans TaxID=35570 RepID=A0A1I8PBI4_STOCA
MSSINWKWRHLLSLLLVFIYGAGSRTSSLHHHGKFVTFRQLNESNASNADDSLEENSVNISAKMPYDRGLMRITYRLHENPYQLKYQPLYPMPRLFWHKFPQKQQEQPMTTPMPSEEQPMITEMQTEQPMEAETEAAPPTAAETEAPPIVEPSMEPEMPPLPETDMPTIAPTDQMMMTTPTSTNATTSTTAPSLKPSTTFTTIMKPPGYFPFNIADKLKNLLIFGSPSKVNLLQKHGNVIPKGKTKSKGFLSLFEVIKFANIKCSVNMGDIRSMEGTCYHEFECKTLGGIPTERCADGVGVCCIFLAGCGDNTEQSVTYFESPNYPQSYREAMICVLIVNIRKNVQQVRVDFLMFELNRPTDGNCEDDQFVVSGQNVNFAVPILCGINTGHHIYIHAGKSPEQKIYLSIFSKVPNGARSFNLKITQLEENLAPDGCLQYYTEPEGIVKSFNYDIEGVVVEDKLATYLNNMNYVICLERLKDTCSVNYVMEQIGSNSELLDFQIVNKNEDENDLVPDGQAGAGIFNCPDDYVAINQVRLCGERFNDGTTNEDFTAHAPIRDVAAGPIILPFRSDEEYVGRGFRLAYRQESCV